MRYVLLGLIATLSACSASPRFNPPSLNNVNAFAAVRKQPIARSIPLFPTQVGWQWTYAVSIAPVNDPEVPEKGSYTLKIDRVQETPQGTRLELRAQSGFTGRFSFPSLVQNAQGINLEDMTFLGLGSDEVEGLKLAFVRLPLQPNAKWEDDNWIGKVKGQERITVPAGSYEAWRVEVIGTLDSAYTAVGNYWLVPGMGVVKSQLTSPGFHIESVLTQAGPSK